MLATVLKSRRATETTFAIIETFAKVRALKRDLVALHEEPDAEKKAARARRFGELLADVVMPDADAVETESALELNFLVGKIKHVVKKIRRNPSAASVPCKGAERLLTPLGPSRPVDKSPPPAPTERRARICCTIVAFGRPGGCGRFFPRPRATRKTPLMPRLRPRPLPDSGRTRRPGGRTSNNGCGEQPNLVESRPMRKSVEFYKNPHSGKRHENRTKRLP